MCFDFVSKACCPNIYSILKSILRDCITCVTVFKDHATDSSFLHLQTSIDMESTLEAKAAFEKWSLQRGVSIKNYHTDNGQFAV